MAKCRVCHKDIARFYNDVCPKCGALNPIDTNYKTKDMTQFVDPITGEELYKSKSKKMASFLQLFLGCFGAPDFYLGFIKRGIIKIIITLLVTGGVGSLLFFLTPATFFLNGNALAFILPFLVVYVVHMVISLKYFLSYDLKDANKEFTH